MTQTEREEVLALEWAGVPQVPQEAGEDTPLWIYAIARVMLYSSRESWAIVKMEYGRNPAVTKSFGDCGIARILSVHPYKFLDAHFVPPMKSAAQTREYIASAYGVRSDELATLKKNELLRMFYNICIKTQLEYESEKQQKK